MWSQSPFKSLANILKIEKFADTKHFFDFNRDCEVRFEINFQNSIYYTKTELRGVMTCDLNLYEKLIEFYPKAFGMNFRANN